MQEQVWRQAGGQVVGLGGDGEQTVWDLVGRA